MSCNCANWYTSNDVEVLLTDLLEHSLMDFVYFKDGHVSQATTIEVCANCHNHWVCNNFPTEPPRDPHESEALRSWITSLIELGYVGIPTKDADGRPQYEEKTEEVQQP